jgi:hypothetical protein
MAYNRNCEQCDGYRELQVAKKRIKELEAELKDWVDP